MLPHQRRDWLLRFGVLLALIGAVAFASVYGGSAVPPEISYADLPDMQDWERYRVDPYIRMAVQLQRSGPEAAEQRLLNMAVDDRAVVLCRMLFVARPHGSFLRAEIGGASFPGGTSYSDWLLEPITLVDGVPFLVVHGYTLAGVPEDPRRYVRYCLRACDWNPYRYRLRTSEEKHRALEKLLASPQWKRPLEIDEERFFAAQIR
jgi:hypothetical protein